MPIEVIFFIEVLAGGLLAGVMYALVALGFVLIYKASGVFNFAQGAMVFFAALTFVSLVERGWNFWLALVATLAVMVVLGLVTERVVLRPLVNQPQITLFMATIGLTFVLEGLSQLIWGSQPHGLELGIPDIPMEWLSQKWNINISQFDLFAAFIAGLLVAVLAVFFQKTRIGRALRAVADDHQAALAVGIPLQHIWAIVWAVAGFVALVAGLMWGVRNGVQFALTFVALGQADFAAEDWRVEDQVVVDRRQGGGLPRLFGTRFGRTNIPEVIGVEVNEGAVLQPDQQHLRRHEAVRRIEHGIGIGDAAVAEQRAIPAEGPESTEVEVAHGSQATAQHRWARARLIDTGRLHGVEAADRAVPPLGLEKQSSVLVVGRRDRDVVIGGHRPEERGGNANAQRVRESECRREKAGGAGDRGIRCREIR
jgi:branched-chain amino acid transport system permease protein